MLIFIGLGLSLDLMPLGSFVKLVRNCDKIVVDSYTSIWFPNLLELVNIFSKLGKEIVIAKRNYLEGTNPLYLIEESRKRNVCIAVSGDPFIATTHIALAVEGMNRDIDVEVVPGTSIVSVAMSVSCLQSYRFGKMVTLVKPREGIRFEYPLMVIKENRSRNLHSLLLLDLDIESGYYMTPSEAAEIIIETQKSLGIEVINANTDKLVILEALGSANQSIHLKTLNELLHEKNIYKQPPYTIIVPAQKLHPIEEECLRNISKLRYRPSCSIHELHHIADILTIT